MRSATLRHIIATMAIAFIVIGVLEFSLPCSTWRWPVSAIGIVVPLLMIRATGTNETKPEISRSVRAFIALICIAWLFSAAGTAAGLLC